MQACRHLAAKAPCGLTHIPRVPFRLCSKLLFPTRSGISSSQRVLPHGVRSQGHLATESQPATDLSPAHIPVLLEEVLHQFSECSLESFVDGTLGAGGHSAAILQAHPEIKSYVGLDVDPVAHDIASQRLQQVVAESEHSCQISLYKQNYSKIQSAVSNGIPGGKASGILLDLGVSSMQIDAASRGFSFMQDGPLDMRMDDSAYLSAELIVNTWSEHDLGKLFKEYGEERHWKAYASRIVDRRSEASIKTTKQLVQAIGRISSGSSKNSRKGIHPATRIFQALRIAVNTELEHLSAAIPACFASLAPKGRLAVITFHSLEDRIVKQAFLKASGRLNEGSLYEANPASKALGKILTRKPIVPSDQEQNRNPRSRSAKMRVFECLEAESEN